MPSLSLGRWPSRLRLLVARRPWIYWLAVAGLTAAITASVVSASARVERARESWGRTTSVVVATRDLAPGDALAGRVTTREVPVAMAPPSALVDVVEPATAIQRVGAGEIVVAGDVAHTDGALALLPVGWLAIQIDGAPTQLSAGDPAAVLADGRVVAREAVVIGGDLTGTLIGVPQADAAEVADAASRGTAVVALSATPRRR